MKITDSEQPNIAPSLQSGASQADTPPGASAPPSNEVLPHHYGTPQKAPPDRAAESVHSKADAGSGRTPALPQSGCLGQSGVDGEQLGGGASIDSACRAAAIGVGSQRAPSPDRAGDRPGPSLGQQEAIAAPDPCAL